MNERETTETMIFLNSNTLKSLIYQIKKQKIYCLEHKDSIIFIHF